MSEHREDINRLAEEFEGCQKILLALIFCMTSSYTTCYDSDMSHARFIFWLKQHFRGNMKNRLY